MADHHQAIDIQSTYLLLENTPGSVVTNACQYVVCGKPCRGYLKEKGYMQDVLAVRLRWWHPYRYRWSTYIRQRCQMLVSEREEGIDSVG